MRLPARNSPTLDDPLVKLSFAQKIGLAAEIAASYCRARWWVRRLTVGAAATAARASVGAAAPAAEILAVRRLGFRLGRVVEKSIGYLPGDTRCLTRSLVLVRLLANRGVTARLVIGVMPDPFRAHAWVELLGEPILDPTEYATGRLAEF